MRLACTSAVLHVSIVDGIKLVEGVRQQLESFGTEHPIEFAILGFANKWPGHETLEVHVDVGKPR